MCSCNSTPSLVFSVVYVDLARLLRLFSYNGVLICPGINYLLPGTLFSCKPWVCYQKRKIAGYACDGNIGNVFPATDFKEKTLVRDPGMHHSTCVRHVTWCMSRSLTRCGGENVPGIPGWCTTRNFAHMVRGLWWMYYWKTSFALGVNTSA